MLCRKLDLEGCRMQKYTASVITAGCLWGLMGLFTRTLATYGVDSMGAIVLRCGIAALLFAVTLLVRDPKQFRIRFKDIWCFIGTGICSLLFFTYCYFQAITIMDLSTAAVLLYTAPVWVAVFSRLLFRERISPRKIGAIGVALTGTTLVCFSGGSLPGQSSLSGIACGLLTGLCYASHYPFYRWWQSRYATATIYGFMLAGGVLALWFCVPVSLNHGPRVWFWLAVLGVTSTFFAYTCYGQGLKRISLVRAAVTCHLEPVLSTLWVWLFWQENFGLVLAAVLLLTTDKSRD